MELNMDFYKKIINRMKFKKYYDKYHLNESFKEDKYNVKYGAHKDMINYCPILYGTISQEKREELVKKLTSLYNRMGIDSDLNIHDFVLAENTLNYLITIGNIKNAESKLSE